MVAAQTEWFGIAITVLLSGVLSYALSRHAIHDPNDPRSKESEDEDARWAKVPGRSLDEKRAYLAEYPDAWATAGAPTRTSQRLAWVAVFSVALAFGCLATALPILRPLLLLLLVVAAFGAAVAFAFRLISR